jgi:hypothetical protein
MPTRIVRSTIGRKVPDTFFPFSLPFPTSPSETFFTSEEQEKSPFFHPFGGMQGLAVLSTLCVENAVKIPRLPDREVEQVTRDRSGVHPSTPKEDETMLKRKRRNVIGPAVLAGVLLFAALCLVGPAERQAFGQGSLFIYPKNGQSEDQQRKDKYECHMWAVQQTGFDPSAPVATSTPSHEPQGEVVRGAARGAALGAIGGAIAGDAGKGAAVGAAVGGGAGAMRRRGGMRAQHQQMEQQQAMQQQQRGNYDRAYGTCLEGRGYTVN